MFAETTLVGGQDDDADDAASGAVAAGKNFMLTVGAFRSCYVTLNKIGAISLPLLYVITLYRWFHPQRSPKYSPQQKKPQKQQPLLPENPQNRSG